MIESDNLDVIVEEDDLFCAIGTITNAGVTTKSCWLLINLGGTEINGVKAFYTMFNISDKVLADIDFDIRNADNFTYSSSGKLNKLITPIEVKFYFDADECKIIDDEYNGKTRKKILGTNIDKIELVTYNNNVDVNSINNVDDKYNHFKKDDNVPF